jgi:hypothetical protein
MRRDADYAGPYNQRAWIWATCPEARFRDGKKAVESATRACELADWKEPDVLSTLAAASAESGDFDSAVKWQEKAQGLYWDADDKEQGLARLILYQAKKPYRETPGSKH